MESILLLILPRLPKCGGFLQSIVINPCSSHSPSRCPSHFGQTDIGPHFLVSLRTVAEARSDHRFSNQDLLQCGTQRGLEKSGADPWRKHHSHELGAGHSSCSSPINQVTGPSRAAPTTYHTAHSPSFSHARSPESQFYV